MNIERLHQFTQRYIWNSISVRDCPEDTKNELEIASDEDSALSQTEIFANLETRLFTTECGELSKTQKNAQNCAAR